MSARCLQRLLLSVLLSWLPTTSIVSAQDLDDASEIDREYVLESTMLGYTGIGGEIDGVRNPVLTAEEGEVVRITIVNGETLVHDLKMEELGVKTDEVLEVGERASVTFTAVADDIYFCTIPGHRAAGMEGRFEIVSGDVAQDPGQAPPINVDFEDGTLADWTAVGTAFDDQPVSSVDIEASDEHEPASNYDGDYWIDTGALAGSAPTGRLQSAPFEVTHPYAAFLIAGGAFEGTHVELRRADDGTIFYSISGHDGASLRPVVVDVSEYMGEDIFIEIVDEETGERSNPFHDPHQWAHIRFDRFRFYETRPSFPNELTREETEPLPALQLPEHAGLSAEEAVEAMDLPEGFSVQVAASEPDVVRPIAFTYDDRGRLWVAEGRTYPRRAPDGEGQDRILIFEDTNGDGTLNSRKVFVEGLNLVSGIEVGFDGVWVGAAPYLMYIPIDASGDRPAGEPEILLDGWGYHDTHETLNSFRWSPDGWLYGTQGVFTHSNVGEPGTPDSLRTPLNAGVWRYHPTRHEFEVYAHGTSNPWGLDWNEYGQPFITACVIPHLYHVVQGARYFRQAGEHFNPYTYDDIETIADHVHWVGDKGWAAGSRRGGGGGHAHAGAMIYQGGSWPDTYRSRILMNNIHGYRVNADVLERDGSGYRATHGDDFLMANDAWSQMLNLRYGPGGSVHA
ncbi:MAG: PVC-type heme-binding CxxCH protein, partial [Rhodothermales bacterium]